VFGRHFRRSEMKGFPPTISGPRGLWYRKVRAIVGSIREGDPKGHVEHTLGEPDLIRHDGATGPGQWQSMMTDLAGGPTAIAYGDSAPVSEVLLYRDPYRPRRLYAFGLVDERVRSMWEETVAARHPESRQS